MSLPPLKLTSSHETGDEGNPKKQRFTVSCQPALGRLPRQQFGFFVDGFWYFCICLVSCQLPLVILTPLINFMKSLVGPRLSKVQPFSWISCIRGPPFPPNILPPAQERGRVKTLLATFSIKATNLPCCKY